MNLDPKIKEAIEMAVKEAGQPQDITRSLVAWMTAVTSGKEDAHDPASAPRRVDILYTETQPDIIIDGVDL